MDRVPHSPRPLPAIALPRKILCALALLGAALLALPAGASAGGRPAQSEAASGPRLLHAHLSQAGQKLIVSLRTSSPVPLADLEARPDTRRAASRYLCVGFARRGSSGERRLCLGGPKPRHRVGVVAVGGAGKPAERGSARATVKRPTPTKLVLALVPADAGLAAHRYFWRVLRSPGCEPGGGCAESLPAQGASAFRLRPVRPVGCTGGSDALTFNGPSTRKVVALTFDDGPSEYTPEFLRVLREKGVHGTFFEVGQEMRGREETMRQILAEGNEIGDHTMNHVELPGYGQIAGAASLITSITHFKPCLFRPPYGAVDSGVLATAGGLGLRTIMWSVDPRDWSLPGTGAIYSNIVNNARPGSIILMHDGGGPRSETLAALPHVIDTLRARGYGFETVTQLLGYRMIYRPYG